MGTRTNIRITTEGKHRPEEQMMIYRHYDGYPSAVMPDLFALCNIHLKSDNLTQTPERAKKVLDFISMETQCLTREAKWFSVKPEEFTPKYLQSYFSKLSQYEETDGFHGDIEYFYEVELIPSYASITSYSIKYVRDKEGNIDWSVPMENRLSLLHIYEIVPYGEYFVSNHELNNYLIQNPETYNCGFDFTEVREKKAVPYRYVPQDWDKGFMWRKASEMDLQEE
jgi:hypothetical protein